VEGALAPDPLKKIEPLREIPGLKKRERTWKDEVRERVRQRRRDKGMELPLFRDADDVAVPPELPPAAPPPAPVLEPQPAPYAVTLRMAAVEPKAEDPLDLPLRPLEPASLDEELARVEAREPAAGVSEQAEERDVWALPLEEAPAAPRPVERPARLSERLQAASVDAALLLGLFAVVVYFASRAAQVSVEGLLPAWPYVAGYLAFLGLAYATYFTGTTGQTLGKILGGLRVVDTSGRAPGYPRAALRALLGALGVAAAGLGLLPGVFDPARRALHDRLLRTRVVKL
jgi:uncharacterized RDD family membrane protein YckC